MTYPTEPQPPSPELNYQSGTPYSNAPTLVLLTVIFNFVLAGLDCLYALLMIVGGIFMYVMFHKLAGMPTRPGAPPPPEWVPLVYLAIAPLVLGASIVNFLAAMKVKRHAPNAWGWGLAAAIVNCVQLWCSWLCIVPLANGIFSIVVLCQPKVQAFLRSPLPQSLSARAFPLSPDQPQN
jgi:hypothetical protein